MQASDGDERERLYRLRKTCEGGLAAAELAEAEDEFENKILAARVDVEGRGDAAAERAGEARGARRRTPTARSSARSRRTRRPRSTRTASELLAKGEALEAELTGEPDNVARNEEEKQISLRELERALAAASAAVDERVGASCAQRWFDRLLGTERDDVPASFHSAYMRRLSPLESTYTKERARRGLHGRRCGNLGFDMENDENIRLDLDDRPQKSPRACVIASDPPKVVHLITRAQGGLHDYQAFLHEAGHALHYAGCDPSLPYAFRRLSRDHALTEIYSYILEAITREPAWHARYFGLERRGRPRRTRSATLFLETLLFRRYVAKLQYELDFWSRYNDVGAKPDGLCRPADERRRPALPRGRLSCPTWTPASTRPTTCARGSARRSCARTCGARSARTGGGTPRPATACARSSSRARARRARRSPAGSASSRSTRARSSPS